MYAIRKKITTTAYMLQLRKAKLIGMKGSLLTSKIKISSLVTRDKVFCQPHHCANKEFALTD